MKQIKCLVYTSMILLLAGCAKDIDVFIPYETNHTGIGDITTFFNIVRTDSYLTTWNSNEAGLLISPKGTRFHIKAHSFQLPDGTVVSDSIDIEIKEIFSKGDMVKNQTPTIANGRLLMSAGEFFIRATQGGQELTLVPDFSIKIQIPHTNPINEMELFYGEEISGIGVNWVEADGNPNTWANVQIAEWASSNGDVGLGYEMEVTQLNWINCDAFVDVNTSLVETCIELPDTYTNTNTVVYVVFSDLNGIMPMVAHPANQRFCQANLPESGEVTYIVVSHQGSDVEGQPVFHFGTLTTTVSTSMIEIIPVEASISEIVTTLDGL